VISWAPRLYDATSAASVVASGTWYVPRAAPPSMANGPASPTGTRTVPMKFSTLRS